MTTIRKNQSIELKEIYNFGDKCMGKIVFESEGVEIRTSPVDAETFNLFYLGYINYLETNFGTCGVFKMTRIDRNTIKVSANDTHYLVDQYHIYNEIDGFDIKKSVNDHVIKIAYMGFQFSVEVITRTIDARIYLKEVMDKEIYKECEEIVNMFSELMSKESGRGGFVKSNGYIHITKHLNEFNLRMGDDDETYYDLTLYNPRVIIIGGRPPGC